MGFLLHLLRLACLLGAAMGVAAFVLWNGYASEIHRFDVEQRQAYGKEIRELFGAARRDLAEQPAKARKDLEECMEELRHAQRGDRLFPLRREVFLFAANMYAKGNDLPRAIAILDDHLARDPLDLPVAIDAAQLLLRKGDRNQAQERLALLFDRYGHIPFLAQAYLPLLEDPVEHAAALGQHLSLMQSHGDAMQNFSWPWEVFFGPDENFAGDRKLQAEPSFSGDTLRIPFEVPAGQRFCASIHPSTAPWK